MSDEYLTPFDIPTFHKEYADNQWYNFICGLIAGRHTAPKIKGFTSVCLPEPEPDEPMASIYTKPSQYKGGIVIEFAPAHQGRDMTLDAYTAFPAGVNASMTMKTPDYAKSYAEYSGPWTVYVLARNVTDEPITINEITIAPSYKNGYDGKPLALASAAFVSSARVIPGGTYAGSVPGAWEMLQPGAIVPSTAPYEEQLLKADTAKQAQVDTGVQSIVSYDEVFRFISGYPPTLQPNQYTCLCSLTIGIDMTQRARLVSPLGQVSIVTTPTTGFYQAFLLQPTYQFTCYATDANDSSIHYPVVKYIPAVVSERPYCDDPEEPLYDTVVRPPINQTDEETGEATPTTLTLYPTITSAEDNVQVKFSLGEYSQTITVYEGTHQYIVSIPYYNGKDRFREITYNVAEGTSYEAASGLKIEAGTVLTSLPDLSQPAAPEIRKSFQERLLIGDNLKYAISGIPSANVLEHLVLTDDVKYHLTQQISKLVDTALGLSDDVDYLHYAPNIKKVISDSLLLSDDVDYHLLSTNIKQKVDEQLSLIDEVLYKKNS